MKSQIEKLGKVSITVEQDYWNINNSYDKLVVVERESTHTCYLSRKPVHPGVSIDNREYWVKFSKYPDIPYEIVQELGDSYELAVSQRTITANFASLQEQINQIVDNTLNIDFTLSPNIVFVGDTPTVNINITTDMTVNDILLHKDEELIASGSGTSLTYTDVNEEPLESNINYSVTCNVNSVNKTVNKTLNVVNKIYYGAGTNYTDAVTIYSPSINPKGHYDITVQTSESHIYFNVPNYMDINNATLSGFDFPLDEPTAVTIDNTEYKSYRSSNTVDAGTYEIIIS